MRSFRATVVGGMALALILTVAPPADARSTARDRPTAPIDAAGEETLAADAPEPDDSGQDEIGQDGDDARSDTEQALEDVRELLAAHFQVYVLMQEIIRDCRRLSDAETRALDGWMRDLRGYVEREQLLDEATLQALPEKVRAAKTLEGFAGCGDLALYFADATVVEVHSTHRRLGDLGAWTPPPTPAPADVP
jgi:hypothetical protein